MTLIDTHAHIYYDNYTDCMDDIIKSATDNGVEKIISIGVDLKSSEKCIKLAEKYESVYATCGIHPHESDKAEKKYLYQLEENELSSGTHNIIWNGDCAAIIYRKSTSHIGAR